MKKSNYFFGFLKPVLLTLAFKDGYSQLEPESFLAQQIVRMGFPTVYKRGTQSSHVQPTTCSDGHNLQQTANPNPYLSRQPHEPAGAGSSHGILSFTRGRKRSRLLHATEAPWHDKLDPTHCKKACPRGEPRVRFAMRSGCGCCSGETGDVVAALSRLGMHGDIQ
jgi:hypothetical protein